jgi:exopolysaccharide biosynthesis polyprenyl glycosylphosphotransferase
VVIAEVEPSVAADRWIRPALVAQAGRTVAIVACCLAVTLASGDRTASQQVGLACVLTGIWLVSIYAGFAASRTTLAALGRGVAVVRGVVLGLLLTASLEVWVPSLALGRGAIALLAVSEFVFVLAWELIATRILPPLQVLVIGPSEACIGMIGEFRRRRGQQRLSLAGIVDDDADVDARSSLLLGTTPDIPEIIAELRPDLVALAPGCNRPETFARLLDSAEYGFKVLELAQLYEHAFGRVPVRDLTKAWFMSVMHLYQRPYSVFAKRATDIVGAVIILVLSLPLLPLLALAVIRTGRPVLLRQNRVGEHGQVFTMFKFRTMRVDAEASGQAVWAAKNDPRVTEAGRIMRRFRLDELPQVWNILKGEMSLVGPRPERPEFIDELLDTVPFWERRHLVKPGITGWAQVNRGYTADTRGSLDKLSYDLWYIRHRSLTVDLVICARTLITILRGEWGRSSCAEEYEYDPLVSALRYTASLEADPGQV